MKTNCPICGAGGLGNLEYKDKRTDIARFTTCRCKRCNCCWHVAIYPGRSMNHIDSVIRSYLTEVPMKKIAAIKAYRSVISGTGLREAKDYVEAIESGMYVTGQLTKNPNVRRIRGY